MLLKHVHTDKNDDYKCDICGLKYRFEVTEDVPVELTVPANDTFELVFTPERTGKYTASTLSGGSFYRGDMYVNSFSDGYYVVICDSAGHELVKGNNEKATCTVEQMKQSETFTVKIVDGNNITQKDGSGAELSKKIEVKVKTGFFDKLIAFFKGLFKILPQVTIEP